MRWLPPTGPTPSWRGGNGDLDRSGTGEVTAAEFCFFFTSAARDALKHGDGAGAVMLARAAALRHLADAKKVRLHRSRTDLQL